MNIIDEIYLLLETAIGRLIKNRLEKGYFDDDGELIKERAYCSTLEGLDALLIPLVNLPKTRIFNPTLENYPDVKTIFIDDITFIVNFNLASLQYNSDQGRPYFYTLKHKPYWACECSSFSLSVLSNYLELKRKYGLQQWKPNSTDINKVIQRNLGWVSTCKRDNGWAWVPEQLQGHPWPTWSLLDTFNEIHLYKATRDKYYHKLKADCDKIRNYILDSFESNDPNQYGNLWKTKVLKMSDDRLPYDITTALDLSRLMLGAILHAEKKQILPLAIELYKWAAQSDFNKCDYSYNLEEKDSYIPDDSLLPSVFRSLIVMASSLGPRLIGDLEDELDTAPEYILNKVYNILQKGLITDGEYSGLWGIKDGDDISYELYYTERVIEALVEFIMCYKRADVSLFQTTVPKEYKEIILGEPMNNGLKKKATKTPPERIDKYSSWIPELAMQTIPTELDGVEWTPDKLFEFYIFRLFEQVFVMDGAQWGYLKSGQALPDGRFTMFSNKKEFHYDAKSSKKKYEITKDELRKFIDYCEEGKKEAVAKGTEVQYFLIIAPDFKGTLNKKSEEFMSKTGTKLVCVKADNICNFANHVVEMGQNVSTLRLIEWESLFAKGDPLLSDTDFNKIFESWKKRINRKND